MACANCPFSLSLVHSIEPAVQENGDDTGEGREAEPGSPRRCDIIVISGRKEKCEAAKEALEVRGMRAAWARRGLSDAAHVATGHRSLQS